MTLLSSHRLTVDPRNPEYVFVVHYRNLLSFLCTEGITLPTTLLSTTSGLCLHIFLYVSTNLWLKVLSTDQFYHSCYSKMTSICIIMVHLHNFLPYVMTASEARQY